MAEANAEYHTAVNTRYRILSLADSCENGHLWIRYADNYAGTCLQFFVDPMFGTAYQMRYSDTVPALDITDNEGFTALNMTALVKRKRWANEGEYRLIVGEPPIPGDPPLEAQKLRFAPELLTGILLGDRIPPREREQLENAFLAAPVQRKIFTVFGGVPFRAMQIVPDAIR